MIVASDEHWQTRQGPICYSDFLMGEMYDARLELQDWATAPGVQVGWQPAEVFTPDPRAPELDAARVQPAQWRVSPRNSHTSQPTARRFLTSGKTSPAIAS